MSYSEEDEEEYDDFYVHWTDQITPLVGLFWFLNSILWASIFFLPDGGSVDASLGAIFFLLGLFWPITAVGMLVYGFFVIETARAAEEERKPWLAGLAGAMVISVFGFFAAMGKYWFWFG